MVEKLDTKLKIDDTWATALNLSGKLSEKDRQTLGSWVLQGYIADKATRQKWERRSDAAMDLAMQVVKEKTFPWPGAANVVFPLVTIASLQFSARSLTNLIQGENVYRYKVNGIQTDPKAKETAVLMGQHLSWQVLEQDTEWEPQHDRLFIYTSIVGTGFIKTSHDPDLEYPIDRFVTARDLVVDFNAESVESAARKTHVVPIARNKIYSRIQRKVYQDCSKEDWYLDVPKIASEVESEPDKNNRVGLNTEATPDFLTPFRCYEQHVLLDLDQDGYYEPYIVTVESNSGYVLRLVSRWNTPEDVERDRDSGAIIRIKAHEYFTAFGFIPNPESNIYSIGFGTLLGPLNEAVSSGINQILDAGTMANSNGGFLSRGVKIRGGVLTIAPWEWKRVDSTGDDLRKSMVPLPVNPSSTVMFQLLGLIIQYSDRVAGTQEMMVGENPGQNTPAETSRSMVEQGMQVYAAIFKRFWRSMKNSAKKRHILNGMYLPEKSSFGKGSEIMRQWYKQNPDLVSPVANPNVTSKGQRVQKTSMVRQAAHTVPGYDVAYVERQWLLSLDVDDIDQAYPGPDKTPPLPNPKMQVEEMKLKNTQIKIDFEKERFAHELLEQKRLNNATIAEIEARAISLIAAIGKDNAALQITAFDSIVQGMKSHNEMIDSRLQTLQGGQENGGSDKPDGGAGKASSGAGASAA